VKVRNEDVSGQGELLLSKFVLQLLPQNAKTGATIKNVQLFADAHLDAGGIASIAHVFRLRGRRGTRTPQNLTRIGSSPSEGLLNFVSSNVRRHPSIHSLVPRFAGNRIFKRAWKEPRSCHLGLMFLVPLKSFVGDRLGMFFSRSRLFLHRIGSLPLLVTAVMKLLSADCFLHSYSLTQIG